MGGWLANPNVLPWYFPDLYCIAQCYDVFTLLICSSRHAKTASRHGVTFYFMGKICYRHPAGRKFRTSMRGSTNGHTCHKRFTGHASSTALFARRLRFAGARRDRASGGFPRKFLSVVISCESDRAERPRPQPPTCQVPPAMWFALPQDRAAPAPPPRPARSAPRAARCSLP
jgi:hypothetical protein